MPWPRRFAGNVVPYLSLVFTLAFIFFSFSSPPETPCAQVTLAWDANSESLLAGYKLHYGLSSGNYTSHVDAGKQTTYTISGLQNGTKYFFSATAYDTSGVESGYSAEVAYTTPASTCTYSVSPAAQSFSASGGPGAVSVGSNAGCAWTAVSNSNWLLITSNSSSSGAGTVNYSVSSNTGTASRTGTLTIAGQPFTVTQSGTVNYTITASAGSGGSISPSGAVAVSAGGSQSFTISPASGYQVSSVVVDGSNVGALATYTFTNLTGNHTVSVSFAPSSGSWAFCATEGELCSFTGTKSVRYGANGVYAYKTLTNGTMCTNSVFGDPINGIRKQCYAQGSGTFTITASAGIEGSISPSGAVQVPAGGSQSFTIAPASGYQVSSVLVDGTNVGAVTTYTFSNVTADHAISASFTPSSGGWTFCANENQFCSFTGTQNVRYGADGVYVVKTLTNGTMCSNSVFGDPAWGVGKQCDVSPSAGSTVFAMNSGGPQYTHSNGTVYQSDRYYSGGSTGSSTAAISGTSNDPLYQSERYGNFSYSIPLPNGNYTVLLRFAEIYWSAAGQRVFDVYIEGTKVIGNLDIFALVGQNAAYTASFPATVNDGKLDIRFSTIADNAKVSAIAVETR